MISQYENIVMQIQQKCLNSPSSITLNIGVNLERKNLLLEGGSDQFLPLRAPPMIKKQNILLVDISLLQIFFTRKLRVICVMNATHMFTPVNR